MYMPCTNSRILIVDDDSADLAAASVILRLSGFGEVETEIDSSRVIDKMSGSKFDVVLLDLNMPCLSGVDLLPQLVERFPETPVIMLTSSYDVNQIVACMKLGAFDYLVKPADRELLVTTLRKALEHKALSRQVSVLQERLINHRLEHPEAFAEFVTRNSKMRSLFEYLEIVSLTPKVVLITGESGTGKELIARIIHRLSCCKGELVPVNVAGLDDMMFSDTLFGHKKGAFTGAEQAREGLIVKAAEGVLFLDEIGDLAETSQIKLLRLIQEREYYPAGSDVPSKCRARIICATNRNLGELVKDGKFRNDLYFRLNVHHVALPPLRERKEDLPLLLDHLVGQAAREMGFKVPACPKELLDLLAVYHFPGNVRELQCMVFDAVARSKGGILSCEPFRQFMAAEKANPHRVLSTDEQADDSRSFQGKVEWVWGHFPTLREVEDSLIDAALAAANGNQGIAATMLGLKRPALTMRLKVRKNRI